MFQSEACQGRDLDGQSLVLLGKAVDLGRDHDDELGSSPEALAGGDDGEVDWSVRSVLWDRVDLVWLVVVVDYVSLICAIGVVVEDGCAAGVDEDGGFAEGGALGDAVDDRLDGG